MIIITTDKKGSYGQTRNNEHLRRVQQTEAMFIEIFRSTHQMLFIYLLVARLHKQGLLNHIIAHNKKMETDFWVYSSRKIECLRVLEESK